MYTLRGNGGGTLKIGDRVKILCPEVQYFCNKVGIITLIEPSNGRKYSRIFVQMEDTGGGRWWRPNTLRHQRKKKNKKEKHELGSR